MILLQQRTDLVGMALIAMALAGCNALFGEDFTYADHGTDEIHMTESTGGSGMMPITTGSIASAGVDGDDEPIHCDDVDATCGACTLSTCAESRCEVQIETCYGDSGCNAFINCSAACAATDEQCWYHCTLQHWSGQEDFWAMVDCLACEVDTCGSACASEYECGWPDSCTECIYTEKALATCQPQYDACKSEPDCFDLDWCAKQCADDDSSCLNDCAAQFSSGITEYNAFHECLYCDTNACGTECQFYVQCS